MKKLIILLLVTALSLSLAACEKTPAVSETESAAAAASVETNAAAEDTAEATVEPPADTESEEAAGSEAGNDTVKVESEGATEWDPEFTVMLKVTGLDDDILYDGTVTLKSPTVWASEFLKAAMDDKELAYTGIDDGNVTVLGDYAASQDEGLFWLYTVNGNSPAVYCNRLQLRDGDVMIWTYGPYEGESVTENVVTEGTFEVGSDAVEAKAEDAGELDPTYTANLLIVNAIDDVTLFSGTVSLQSPTMWASEFLIAAVESIGLTQTGAESGPLTVIGDIAQNADEGQYWMYYINGITPAWYCNNFQVRDGDYVTFSFEASTW